MKNLNLINYNNFDFSKLPLSSDFQIIFEVTSPKTNKTKLHSQVHFLNNKPLTKQYLDSAFSTFWTCKNFLVKLIDIIAVSENVDLTKLNYSYAK